VTKIPIDRALAVDLLNTLSGLAEDQIYGVGVHCDDPRDFSPDPDCSTEAERAAHAEACRRADAGETVEIPRHRWQTFASREEVDALMASDPTIAAVTFAGPGKPSHVNVQTWGMGTSIIRDRKMEALRDRLAAELREHDAANPMLPGLTR
jgi:hypothetical protein